jgi:response regulator RpfG family c-di-GMP phosphodiesterase
MENNKPDNNRVITVIKNPVGRPRLSDEEKKERLEKYREKNRITQENLRKNNPEICREYRKKYYNQHQQELRAQYAEMKTVYALFKEGRFHLIEQEDSSPK